MKYKVGDVVKLRDDLRIGKKYGGITFTAYKNEFKNESIKVIEISEGDDTYRIVDEDKNAGWISEEMIEGLWEEYKSTEQVSKSEGKYKLIDILNKIANGELKEGTEIKLVGSCDVFTYRRNDAEEQFHELIDDDGENIFKNYYMELLTDECELIEPHQFREDTKMIEPTDNTKIEELEWHRFNTADKIFKRIVFDKLNEVIRYINKED